MVLSDSIHLLMQTGSVILANMVEVMVLW